MKLHIAAVLAWLKSKKENNGNKRIAVGSKNNSPSGDGGFYRAITSIVAPMPLSVIASHIGFKSS